MCVLICGYVSSGMNICDIGHFGGVVGIGLVADSTLGYGVGFTVELLFLLLCGVVLSVSTLRDPPVFTLVLLLLCSGL